MEKIISSLVVFKELYDKRKDIYDVLCNFILKIINDEQLYVFTGSEITQKLKSHFGFIIPEAIVKTALKRLRMKLEKGKYIVDRNNIKHAADDTASALTSIKNNIHTILLNLYEYIEIITKKAIKNSDKESIKDELYKFLLDNSTSKYYTKYISAYLLFEKNKELLGSLNIMRQGLILYSGFNYEDINSLGSWKNKLTIYIDTEIIFHMGGYNGSIYKSYFDDFYKFVKEINSKAKNRYITLKYFNETNDEIERFFIRASSIIDGKSSINPRNTAMVTITKGCKNTSDLLEKKADLFTLLLNNQIELDDYDYYKTEESYKHNILSNELLEELSNELGYDIYHDSKLLNYINYRRNYKEFENFSNVNYIFLTGNADIIRLAWHKRIKNERKVPLATTLDWITNKFWFKLQKGFGQEVTPLNVDIIIKSKITLSSIINDSIDKKYVEMHKEVSEGKLNEQFAKGRLMHLKLSSKKPEDIQTDNIDEVITFLNEDSLDKYIVEQESIAAKSIENEEKNKKLQLLLDSNKSELTNVTSGLIKQTRETISAKEQTKIFLNNAYGKIRKSIRLKMRAVSFCIFFLYVAIMGGIYYIIINISDYQITRVGLFLSIISISMPLLLSIRFRRKIQDGYFMKRIRDYIKRHEEKKNNFSSEMLLQVDNEIKILTEELKELEMKL